LVAHADRELHIHSESRPWAGRFGDVYTEACRVAGGLEARGIGPGDVVAFQVPNWIEAAITFYAAALLGTVLVPIVHFYGAKEVGHILRESGAKALITADAFGHLDYLANLERVRPGLTDLDLVAVVGATTGRTVPAGCVPFADLAERGRPLAGPVAVDPMAPAAVAYTSGTTADPKGVIHLHRTLVGEIRQLSSVQPNPDPADTATATLNGAPVAHAIGMLGGLLIPAVKGNPIHLTDVWNPGRVLAIMAEYGLAGGSGATYFLTSLLDHPDYTDEHLKLMARVGLGGSSIPAAVAERARALGISIVRMYGSTEHPSTTGQHHEEPEAKRLYTDGHPLAGVEIRLVDEADQDVEPGQPGEILSRGPDCFAGYTDPALTARAFAADWYRSEDIGVLDEDGYLTITDRKKDIIIRGGENISALEVEQLLVRLPGVAEAAVVAAPDARLGEHACAYFRMQEGATAPDLGAVRQSLEAAGLARQKWPEEIQVVAEFPRTPSGKIQKYVLRQQLRSRP
jgi:acyl-CoA synthetase (AMP-forming)/AMP-acid ligase II